MKFLTTKRRFSSDFPFTVFVLKWEIQPPLHVIDITNTIRWESIVGIVAGQRCTDSLDIQSKNWDVVVGEVVRVQRSHSRTRSHITNRYGLCLFHENKWQRNSTVAMILLQISFVLLYLWLDSFLLQRPTEGTEQEENARAMKYVQALKWVCCVKQGGNDLFECENVTILFWCAKPGLMMDCDLWGFCLAFAFS